MDAHGRATSGRSTYYQIKIQVATMKNYHTGLPQSVCISLYINEPEMRIFNSKFLSWQNNLILIFSYSFCFDEVMLYKNYSLLFMLFMY